MNKNTCGICDMIKNAKEDEELLLFKTKYWAVVIASKQKFLGRSYAVTLRHCPSMSDISNEEWLEFAEVVRKYESAVKKAFGPQVFNWACLMNHAFRAKEPNPHVHWHIRPRYRDRVEFEGQIFEDDCFASKEKGPDKKVPLSLMKKIAAKIRDDLE